MDTKSIAEKEKLLLQNTLIIAIVGGLSALYYGMCMMKYQATYPRAEFMESISGALALISKPKELFPVEYDMSTPLMLVMLFELVMLMFYFTDKMKIHHDIHTIKGSSYWFDPVKMSKKYADFIGKSYKNHPNNILFSKNFYASLNVSKHFHALNSIIIGTTGSGKSRYILKPNVLQMNTSYVITDPKGELLDSCGEMLRRNGYRVRVFDILDMGNCDTYNPLKYCKKESDVKKIVQAFIKSTSLDSKGSGSKDPFWDDCMNQFLCASISLLTSYPEKIRNEEGEWIDNVNKTPYSLIPEVMGGYCYTPVFANIVELLVMGAAKWTPGCGVDPKEDVNVTKEKTIAGSSKLNVIFENLRKYESELQDCTVDFIEKPYCLREWENLKGTPDKTFSTVVTTISVKLDSFNIKQVRDLTNSDTINLDDFGTKRDALFLIIPPTDRTYNFLVAFLYTQLFDILYSIGAKGSIGSKILKLKDGELVRYFSKEEVDKGINDKVNAIRNAYLEKKEADLTKGDNIKKVKDGKKEVTLEDTWYDIYSADGEYISSRPTKEKADKYLSELKHAKLKNGKNPKLPYHVRFLMDEFANIGELPEFKDKLATVRGYEISCMVIVQSITQLKGMYPDDFEVVDANCPFTVFLGGDENTNNEYLSKKIGKTTVKGANISLDNKQKANSSYNLEERDLMKPEELGRMDHLKEVVLVYGEQPMFDDKIDYPGLPNYNQTHDYTDDLELPDFYRFIRPNSSNEKIQTKYKIKKPTIIPQTSSVTFDLLKQHLGAQDVDDACEKIMNNIERFSFKSNVDNSAPLAF